MPRQGSARERWGGVAQSQLPRHASPNPNQRQRESSPAPDRRSPSRRCSERSGRPEASAASDQGGYVQGGAQAAYQGAPPSLLRGPSPVPGSLRGPSPTLGTQSLLRAPSPHRT